MQDAELVPKREVFQLEGGSRLEACQSDGGQQVHGAKTKWRVRWMPGKALCSHAVGTVGENGEVSWKCPDLFQLTNCSPVAISMRRLSCCAFGGGKDAAAGPGAVE
jgi:hypothetical protein